MKVFALIALSISLIITPQPQSMVSISTPLQGKYAFFGASSGVTGLYSIDTFTGAEELLVQPDTTYGETTSVTWDRYAEKLAFRIGAPFGSSDRAIYDVTQHTWEILPLPQEPEALFFPQGWLSSSDQLLYIVYTPSKSTLAIENLSDNSFVNLLSYERNQSLNGVIPLPANMTAAVFLEIRQAAWNPVYTEWIALQIGVFSENADRAFINIAYNYLSGEMILIDSVIPPTAPIFEWHPSGNLLFYNHLDLGASLVRFYFNGSTWAVELAESTNDTQSEVVVNWIGNGNLGAGNLVLTVQRIDQDRVYSVAEIINGTWYSEEFFRLPDEQFSVGDSDWVNIASEEENKELSCIFDQTLPSQLQLGQRGRVTFTDGTPSRLRAKPGSYSDIITQMPEGTEFDVIALPECQNGYRWWQLQLDDGTIGYAAEADTESYFLEPIER